MKLLQNKKLKYILKTYKENTVKDDDVNRLEFYRQVTTFIPILGHKEKSQQTPQHTEMYMSYSQTTSTKTSKKV